MYAKVILLSYPDFGLLIDDLVDIYTNETEETNPEKFLKNWFDGFCSLKDVEGIAVYLDNGVKEIYTGEEFVDLIRKEGMFEYFEDVEKNVEEEEEL
jgi:hypothetical protein